MGSVSNAATGKPEAHEARHLVLNMDVWVLAWRPRYSAATTLAPEMIYGWNLLRNGRIIAFVPYRT